MTPKLSKNQPFITLPMHKYTCSHHGELLVHVKSGRKTSCPYCTEPLTDDGLVQVDFYRTIQEDNPDCKQFAEFYCGDERLAFYTTRWNSVMCPSCNHPAEFNGAAYIQVKKK
jgi:DNA-directed RNA polymerase subunit RPC12/RpoP